jgi:hypothetical protein
MKKLAESIYLGIGKELTKIDEAEEGTEQSTDDVGGIENARTPGTN